MIKEIRSQICDFVHLTALFEVVGRKIQRKVCDLALFMAGFDGTRKEIQTADV